MTSGENDLYFEREQTQIKHLVLEKYLERFARIVGQWAGGILYIDGFSGPWNTVSDNFEDSSFAIALRELRSARKTVQETFGKDLKIQCVFLEKDRAAFENLSRYAAQQSDADVRALNLPFEKAIPDLVRIVGVGKRDHFPFILIDPKGWKGFSMEVIAPLIQVKPCEVLVNFMTSHIQRFIEDERDGLKTTFRQLFGDDSFESQIEGLVGQEREDAIVSAYAERLAKVGDFPYVATALVLNPIKDRTHYHLVYATRNIKGIDVFKSAERLALKLSEVVRADAKRRARESASGQLEMLDGNAVPETGHLAQLQTHFEMKAGRLMETMARERSDWDYDALYAAVLRLPIIQESFLKQWLKEHAEVITSDDSRVLKIRSGHRVRIRKL